MRAFIFFGAALVWFVIVLVAQVKDKEMAAGLSVLGFIFGGFVGMMIAEDKAKDERYGHNR